MNYLNSISENTEKVEPYLKLSEIYDRLMEHVDYVQWGNYIKSLLKFATTTCEVLLDISCGTGGLLQNMQVNGIKLFGSDKSNSMLKKAKTKLPVLRDRLFVNDAQNIALKNNSVDVVVFLYDSINYIFNENALAKTFDEIFTVLRRGGLFIFDTVTEYHCQKYYHDYYDNEHWENQGYYRHSYYDKEKAEQYNNFHIICGKKSYIENHVQKIYSVDLLSEFLTNSGFIICAKYDNFTYNELYYFYTQHIMPFYQYYLLSTMQLSDFTQRS